jgi:hypothetical protein
VKGFLVAAVLAAALAAIAVTTADGATRVAIPGCGGADKARYKPTTVYVLCGDGNFRMTHLRWTRWTHTSAAGRGAAKVNNCDPSCAGGTIESYKAKLVASRPKECPNGKMEFVRLTYSFPDQKPDGARRSGTLRRPCSK